MTKTDTATRTADDVLSAVHDLGADHCGSCARDRGGAAQCRPISSGS